MKDNKFKHNLAQLIKESGEENKAIAKKLGITPSNLSNLKSGYNEPNIQLLIDIANYFDVSIDYLVGRVDY